MTRSASKKNKKTEKSDDERLPLPAEEGIEKSILGAFFLDNERFYEATAHGLVAEHFHFGWNRVIFSAITEVLEAGVKADMITVLHYLESQGQLSGAGDLAYLSSLPEGVPDTGAQIAFYVKALRESYLRRELFWMGERLTKMAADPTDPIEFTLSGTHDELLRLQSDSQEQVIPPMSVATTEVLGGINTMMQYDPYRTIGVPFGLTELDELTSGIRKGQFVVVGGFPKSGKTSFVIDTIRKAVSGEFPIPIGFFSREMRRVEVIERLLSQHTEIPYAKIRKPMHLLVSEYKVLEHAKAEMDRWPLYIDDTAINIQQMIPRAHMLIRQKKVELLAFDYLQIIGAAFEKEYDRVSYVANTLTSLAKTTGVPVLAVSQLTRPEGRKGDVNISPTIGMLRSSGQIEQNAHLIVFTYHPVDKETMNPSGEDLAIIGAQRAGPTGRCKTFFNVSTQRWEERGIVPPAEKQQDMPFEEPTHAN